MKNNGRNNDRRFGNQPNGYRVDRITDLPQGISGVRVTLPNGVSSHDIDLNSIVAMLGASMLPQAPIFTEEDADNFEINKVIAENDKYIAPAIRDAAVDTSDLESDLEATYRRLKYNNAIIAENFANEMADVYRRHMATILEYNTQNLISTAQDTRDQLYHLIACDDD